MLLTVMMMALVPVRMLQFEEFSRVVSIKWHCEREEYKRKNKKFQLVVDACTKQID